MVDDLLEGIVEIKRYCHICFKNVTYVTHLLHKKGTVICKKCYQEFFTVGDLYKQRKHLNTSNTENNDGDNNET